MSWGDDTRMQYTETLYSFRPLPNGELQLSKWEGGQVPRTQYEIANMGRGRCNCLGSMRQPYCKHRRMVDKVREICDAAGFPVWGCYWDDSKGVLYTPADGEGVSVGDQETWSKRIDSLKTGARIDTETRSGGGGDG